MRSTLALLVCAPLLLLAAACGGPGGPGTDTDSAPPIDAAVAPVFRNPLPTMTDDDVALQSLQLLGAQVTGTQRNCDVCHALSRTKLHSWLTLSQAAMTNCLTDLAVTDPASAQAMVNCLRDTGDATGTFHPNMTGIYAIAAGLPWFDYLVHLADPTAGDAVYTDFLDRVKMPRGSHPSFTQGEFDIIAEWVSRGMPLVDTLVPDETGGNCTQEITQAMIDHTNQLATTGWTAENLSRGLNMFGCAGAATIRDCLSTYPEASTTGFGTHWADDFPGGKLRVLRTNPYHSSYWTRSSPDGRFVAHGGSRISGASSTVVDLERDGEIGTTALYDPGFFPDNSGFAFQGGSPHLCSIGLLTGATPGSVVHYTTGPGLTACVDVGTVGLYQHLGAAISGDYYTVNGEWENDNGAYTVTSDTVPTFQSNAQITLSRMTHNGTTYVAQDATGESVPFEGDTVISPSSTLLVSRVSGTNGTQAGFRVHSMVTPLNGTETHDIPVIATYCDAGDKPAFSFDERFLVYHHYVTAADAVDLGFTGSSDPNFQPYLTQHASNIYIVDLLTGDKTRVTRMDPGQFALFPHFRSDGWLYFLVRSRGGASTPEYIVASDAGLVIAGN